MELNIKKFWQIKNTPNVSYLDNYIINEILCSFENNEIKKIKKSYKKNNNNINKNNKIKINKDKISNKIKLILNKLSHNNIHNLVLEFIQNIKINTQDDINEFISTIYIKMLSEISFVKVYLDFFKNIICTYNKFFNFNYFYNLIETKFMNDYDNLLINDKNYIIIETMSDDFRINNLILIKEMVNSSYFNNNILELINFKILNQSMYLSDIYFWFKDTEIDLENVNLIKKILNSNDNIEIRDKILLQNLIPNEDEPKKNKIIFKKKYTFDDNVNELLKL
jgi:hypothetical protein